MKIISIKTFHFNDIDLPLPWSFLHRLLAMNGLVNEIEILKPDYSFDIRFLGEAFYQTFFMLSDACRQITRYADVESSMRFTG
jgi:hypothetical protein